MLGFVKYKKCFRLLAKEIRLGEVSNLVVAHKDRLARFAYDFIEEFASWYGCSIIVANLMRLSPQAEMVEDLMAIFLTTTTNNNSEHDRRLNITYLFGVDK